MRHVLRCSRAFLVSLLLWAASPALGATALASEVAWADVATAAATSRACLTAERRVCRRVAPSRVFVPVSRSRGACNPIIRSQRLRSSLPIYLRNCVLLR